MGGYSLEGCENKRGIGADTLWKEGICSCPSFVLLIVKYIVSFPNREREKKKSTGRQKEIEKCKAKARCEYERKTRACIGKGQMY